MNIGLALIAVMALSGAPQQQQNTVQDRPNRELIAWSPVAGQELQYWARFGYWKDGETPKFQEWQATTKMTVVTANQQERYIQTRFLYLSSCVGGKDWRSSNIRDFPTTTQRLNGYGEPMDAEKALPLNRLWVAGGANLCGIQYPRNVVGLNESWTVRDEFGTLNFTYVGKEKVRAYDCYKVSFDRIETENPQDKCSGTYWLDEVDGKVVKLQIGSREEALEAGQSKVSTGYASYLELELDRAKSPRGYVGRK